MRTHADHEFPTKRALSLRACQSALSGRLGPLAPSYPTLKRWAAAGRLVRALAPKGEGAGRYHLDRLIKILLDIDPQRYAGLAPRADASTEDQAVGAPPATATHRPAMARPGEPIRHPAASDASEHLPALRRAVEQVASDLARLAEGLEARLERLEAGVANLEATRRMLMNKTDAELTAWRRRAESAEAQLAEVKRQAGQVDVLRISRLLAQVEEHLATQSRRG